MVITAAKEISNGSILKLTLSNGTIINSVPKVDGNKEYEAYKVWVLNGGITDPEFTAEGIASQQLAILESMIDPHIMKPIKAYNLANGVRFACPQNCKDWTDDITYEHYAFCISAWNYHKNVYKTVRAYQITQTALGIIPTVTEFQAVLDSVVF